ncbi:9479_t:CDS:2 [Racocetra persica]|uniref:9479_t:CDS:1 n=1 Tax=Racocetra persica TaxID=160502 RepID=A0ACA9P9F5_9GLOM|nr:9479_t:CDS:2 [Racocetra persica]
MPSWSDDLTQQINLDLAENEKLGLNAEQATYAVRKYKSYRRVPNNVMKDLDIN